MRRLKTICELLGILLLTGCAQTTYWLKPGATQAEFNRLQAACQNNSYVVPRQAPIQSPPSYRINTQINAMGALTATAVPFKAPYQTLGDSLSGLAATMDHIAEKERFVHNCMVADGWRNVSASEVALTAPTSARVGSDPTTELEGTATGYPDGAGTINLRGRPDVQCVGTFRYAPTLTGGTGVLRCSDGDSASFEFIKLTNASGHGGGTTQLGRPFRFTYGVTGAERERFLSVRTIFYIQLIEPDPATVLYDDEELFDRIGLGTRDVPAAVTHLRGQGVQFVESNKIKVTASGAITRNVLGSVVFELVHDERP